ncbi:uncharacterized protein LOC117580875 [Drosophila guanche]|uniref:uncharacterized protein LOC117580875 n=1 Tax=Drosophila guanche TaxID=7266 RepID=UPI0014710523|nr:uncharacterized protein LOC117580875 [Drosophila guanche]
MNVNSDWDSVNDCAHFNFWSDFREIFACEGVGLLKLVNSAADAWQGLTPKQKKQFQEKQYVAERKAELKRVKKDKTEFGGDGDQFKGNDVPLFNLKSCFSGFFQMFFK